MIAQDVCVEKYQERSETLYHPARVASLQISLDRATKLSLTEQICTAIGSAITPGSLQPGAQLPSWGDITAYWASHAARGVLPMNG
jgi:hypothetical protein